MAQAHVGKPSYRIGIQAIVGYLCDVVWQASPTIPQGTLADASFILSGEISQHSLTPSQQAAQTIMQQFEQIIPQTKKHFLEPELSGIFHEAYDIWREIGQQGYMAVVDRRVPAPPSEGWRQEVRQAGTQDNVEPLCLFPKILIYKRDRSVSVDGRCYIPG